MYPAILQFAQTVAEVSSTRFFKNDVIPSLFYERLAEFIEDRIREYDPLLGDFRENGARFLDRKRAA